MTPSSFPTRASAVAHLRAQCGTQHQRLFDDDELFCLIELFYEAETSQRLFEPEDAPVQQDGAGGHGAYIRKVGVVINLKKASLVSAALMVDILATCGFASLVLSQVMEDPKFVRRLGSSPHLMCILDAGKWSEMSHSEFRDKLSDGACRQPELSCSHRAADGTCGMNAQDLKTARADLQEIHGLT